MTRQRVLILGGSGMLGRDLVANAPENVDVISSDASDSGKRVDITDNSALLRLLDEAKPELVINAAAFTQVDLAESEPALAMAVNARAVGALGKACAARNLRVIHFSTDYVFDGSATRPYTEDSAVAPCNKYGESKLAGELELRESGAESLILRTQWLFGVAGKSFPRTMYDRAVRRMPTKVVNDQHGRPTFTVDLAQATWQLLGARARGVLHVANSGETTWYELAATIFSSVCASDCLEPCTTSEFPTTARRPAFSVLDTRKVEQLLGRALPTWTDALGRYLTALRAQSSLQTTEHF